MLQKLLERTMNFGEKLRKKNNSMSVLARFLGKHTSNYDLTL